MVSVLAVISAVFLTLFGVLGRAALPHIREIGGALSRIASALEGAIDAGAKSVRAEIRDLEDLVDRLPRRWEEIQDEARRLDGRARYAASSARKELAEHGLTDDKLEALALELQLGNDDGGGISELSPMPEAVAGVPGPALVAEPAQDWRDEARLRKFGAL